MNFDANWYGYLYDEGKAGSLYENDRKNVESKNLDDHCLCTDIERMEQIALQVPPFCDSKTGMGRENIEKIGFANITTDRDIWKKVWSTEEKVELSVHANVYGGSEESLSIAGAGALRI